jgi:quinol-cytochrome oxidoreductase complex cytochrome b subunit/mono/diheme cytochrome c family protein
MKSLVNWLDNRTGIRDLMHEALYERIPGGARWRYVWGSTLVFAFFVQAITGFALWMYYSPSAQTAWESVYYIQYQTGGGWLLRGLHHFMAQAMVVLLALHLMQVVIDGAYRAPREVNFWLGLVLMQIVLGLSLTGYLLPWDQKGYWATRVATNLLGVVPLVGPSLQQIVVGGADYGHHTLTRFFALHAGILPASLVFFLVLHIALFRRHGIRYKLPPKFADTSFWPDQVLKDAVACLAVLIVVLVLCLRPFQWASDGVAWGPTGGAELGAPADPSNQYSAARPEWYFLFLFQFLKLFEGWGEQGELLGAVVIPGLIMLGLFLMPIIGRWNLGHRFNIAGTVILLCGVGYLTVAAIGEDYHARWADPAEIAEIRPLVEELGSDEEKINSYFAGDAARIANYRAQLKEFEHYRKSQEYLDAVEAAEAEAHRAIELASGPGLIPTSGAITLLRDDPLTQGPKLFAAHCASCHTYLPPPADGEGPPPQLATATAPNLYQFASRPWIAGFLKPGHISGPNYFGGTAHAEGEMVSFVNDTMSEWPEDEVQKVVIALSAEANLKSQAEADARDAEAIAAGRELIASDERCASCHKFGEAGELGAAPDLTGYGSREWLIGMISDPAHERFYRDANDRMPAFAPGNGQQNLLDERSLGLIVDWLRGEWYEPGHEKASAAESQAAEATAEPEASAASAETSEPTAEANP